MASSALSPEPVAECISSYPLLAALISTEGGGGQSTNNGTTNTQSPFLTRGHSKSMAMAIPSAFHHSGDMLSNR